MTGHWSYSKTFREKQKALGLVQLNLWVPIAQVEEIKAIVQAHIETSRQRGTADAQDRMGVIDIAPAT